MDNLNTSELLELLRDIHLPIAPPEPSAWPLLLSIVLIVLSLLVFLFHRFQQRTNWAKQATRELDTIQRGDNPNAQLQIATLLKRIVITHDKRPIVGRLTGDPWLRYLDQFFNTHYFCTGTGRVFGDALYKPDQTQSRSDTALVISELRKLIRRKDRLT